MPVVYRPHPPFSMLMRLRMLKLSVGKGHQVIKQLCRRVLQYYATVATERAGYVLYRALVYLFCQSIFGIRFSWHYLLTLFKMLLHHLMSSYNWPVTTVIGSDNIVVPCGKNLTLKHHSMQCIPLVAANISSPPPPYTLSWIQHNCGMTMNREHNIGENLIVTACILTICSPLPIFSCILEHNIILNILLCHHYFGTDIATIIIIMLWVWVWVQLQSNREWLQTVQIIWVALGLKGEDAEKQVRTLMYCLGKEAEAVLASTNIGDEEWKVYGLKKFDDHFKMSYMNEHGNRLQGEMAE